MGHAYELVLFNTLLSRLTVDQQGDSYYFGPCGDTGGGSLSEEMLQVCADVFNAEVLADDTPDAAACGAAKRAAHAHVLAAEHDGLPAKLPYEAFLRERVGEAALEVVATPRADAAAVYDDALVARYKGLEDRVAAGDL